MRPDVIELQAFYSARQGQLVRRLVGLRIRELWPDLTGARVLGLGYAVPFLSPLTEAAERVTMVMPRSQGVVRWPVDRPNQTALAAEDELPLADRSVDRVLMVHALEGTENIQRLLREVWRVLADGGQALIVVPNRRGVWCLSEATPFGHGRPFSVSQLKEALRNTLFVPKQTETALVLPPSRSRLIQRTALAWERVRPRWAKYFAGVLLTAAEKQIYVAPLQPEAARGRMRRYVPVAQSLAAERIAARTTFDPPTAGGHPGRSSD